MGSLEARLAELFTDANLDALRFAAGQQVEVERKVRRMLRDVRDELLKADPTKRAEVDALIKHVSEILIKGYREIATGQAVAMGAFAPIAAKGAVNAVNIAVGANLLDMPKRALKVSNLLIEGAPSADWWAGQAYNVRRRFSQVVLSGFAEGVTTDQMARAILGRGPVGRSLPGEGILDVSLREARSLVHASVQTVANAARRDTFKQNSDIVIGVRQISTLDGKTTLQCQARDQKEWTLEGEPVGHKIPYNGGTPLHWGCRSAETSVLKPLVIDGVTLPTFRGSTRASRDGQVDSSLTFEKWLEGKSQDFQDEALGRGRAKLWRDGVITFSDLLDLRGNPLTLKQLLDKYT